jgi:hypothetical protein
MNAACQKGSCNVLSQSLADFILVPVGRREHHWKLFTLALRSVSIVVNHNSFFPHKQNHRKVVTHFVTK